MALRHRRKLLGRRVPRSHDGGRQQHGASRYFVPLAALVFGSVNIDLFTYVTTDLTGNSLTATRDSPQCEPGGKGLNQSIALSRLNVPTRLIGLVGCDRLAKSRTSGP